MTQPAPSPGEVLARQWILPRLRTALTTSPRLPQPPDTARAASVLILLSPRAVAPHADLAVLLVRKAGHLRSHAGQVAFPGGRREAGDVDATAVALREAAEEVALDPHGVDPLGELPQVGLVPSNHTVTPVLAWWREPTSPLVPDGIEIVESVVMPLATLADPAHRVSVRHPAWPATFPGYAVPGWFVWGFTAWLLTHLLTAAGADVAWDTHRVVDIETAA